MNSQDRQREFEETRKRGTMTDKQLAVVLPALSLEKRIETVIAKYVGGAISKAYDGDTSSDKADAQVAIYLTRKMRPWLPKEPT